MQYQQTPQGLETLFNLPVSAAPQALSLLSQQQDADSLTMQNQRRQLDYDRANDPLKLAHSGLANDTLGAQLPGVRARSSMLTRQDKNESLMNDDMIKDMMGKFKSDEIKRHAEDANNMGTRLSQMAEEVFSNPMGGALRVRGELEKMGLGDMWNPAWETSDPGLLARQLGAYGRDLQNTSAKFRQQLELAGVGAEAKVDVAEIQAAARKAAAEASAKGRATTRPRPAETMSQYEARLRAEAAAGDEHAAAALELLENHKRLKASASAQVSSGDKPNLPAMGIPTNNSVKGAKTDGPGEGWTDNGDNTWTKDGVTIRRKGS
jgi:hypothetical protein